MLERGKLCCNAVIATALATSGGNRISLDTEAINLSSYSRNQQCTCISDHLYAVPRLNLHNIEWVKADPIEANSKFVTSSLATTTTATRNILRCCRTSTSSSYFGHPLPLSVDSYSCYMTAVPSQHFFRTVPLMMKDQTCLAIIHETETIPRPIWPTLFLNSREFCIKNEYPEYDSLYTHCGRGCTCTYMYCDWEHKQSCYASAHNILLELSRNLNSLVERQNAMISEEMLHNIPHKAPHGIRLKAGINEYIHHKSSFVPIKWSFVNDEYLCLNCKKNFLPKINPAKSKLYSNVRHFCAYKPAWYPCLCNSEYIHKFASWSKDGEQIETNVELAKRESPSVVLLMNDQYLRTISETPLRNNRSSAEANVCKYLSLSSLRDERIQNLSANCHIFRKIKETKHFNDETKQIRTKIISNEPRYVKHSDSTNSNTLKKGIAFSWDENNCEHDMRGFDADLDFTLDVSRAERLGHAITQAKRKRQWCRALTAFFGFVFFILSVVIVSLSVTRGRKVFGSM